MPPRLFGAISHVAILASTLLALIAPTRVLRAQVPAVPVPYPTDASAWGIRNINACIFGLDAWPVATFQSIFAGHNAGHANFWILWDRIEPSPGAFMPAELDHALAKARSIGARPVMNFKLTGPRFQSYSAPGTFTGPVDLDYMAMPQWPAPVRDGYKGYSKFLYDVARMMAMEIVVQYMGPPYTPAPHHVYVVFHPEPWDEWVLGSTPTSTTPPPEWRTNLDAYVLSYLTVRQAFQDIQDAPETMGSVKFWLSHGSIPRARILPQAWLDEGTEDPSTQPAMVNRLQAYTERRPRELRGLGIPIATTPAAWTWDDVVCFASNDPADPKACRAETNSRWDAWLTAIRDWTVQGYFQFSTQHGHGKPWCEDLERVWFDDQVRQHGGTVLPWMITEAAFEVFDNTATAQPEMCSALPMDWPAMATPAQKAVFLAGVNRFIMQDYARKWCTFLARDLLDYSLVPGVSTPPGDNVFGFCTPVVSGNNVVCQLKPLHSGQLRNYWALYKRCDCATAVSSCATANCMFFPPCTPNAVPATPSTLQRLDPFPSNQAFIELSTEIGQPDSVQTMVEGTYAHYRFVRHGKIVDAMWTRELFDNANNPQDVPVTRPLNYGTFAVKKLDLTGQLVPATWSGVLPTITVEDVAQEPRFVVWTP